MKTMFKGAALGAAILAGTALAAAPANAGVHIGIGIGVPGPVYADPCYDPYYPSYCAYPVFYGPVFYAGRWHNGPHRFRVVNGHRVFWHGGGWHSARIGHGRFGGPHHGSRGGHHHGGGHH